MVSTQFVIQTFIGWDCVKTDLEAFREQTNHNERFGYQTFNSNC